MPQTSFNLHEVKYLFCQELYCKIKRKNVSRKSMTLFRKWWIACNQQNEQEAEFLCVFH